MNLAEYFNTKTKNGFYEFYNVPDRIDEQDSIVFILESGHIEEVKHKKPLCGNSGRRLSELILGTEIPVGLLNKKDFPSIGFMESSPIPLWIKTYEFFDRINLSPISIEEFALVSDLTIVKQEYENLIPQKKYNEFKDWLNNYLTNSKIYDDYEERLRFLWNKNKHFVICGFIAQAFFEKFVGIDGQTGYLNYYKKNEFIKNSKNHVLYFAHPSSWNSIQKEEKTKLKGLIELVLKKVRNEVNK